MASLADERRSGSLRATDPLGSPGDLTITLRSADQAGPCDVGLLILEGDSAVLRRLDPGGPQGAGGAWIIGRAAEADVRLQDQGASRRHARLEVGVAGVVLTDLQSHNGTLLNGEALRAPRLLRSGDVITIGAANLVLCGTIPASPGRPLGDVASLQGRLEDEVGRAARYQRPLGLLCLQPATPLEPAVLAALLDQRLELGDAAAVGPGPELWLLLPEREEDEIRELAAMLLKTIAPAAPGARAGYARAPDDGDEAGALLAAARAAAARAAAGLVAAASEAAERHIGDLTVIVADPAMTRLYALIERLGPGDLSVLLQGETGTGKEIVAQVLHHHSGRRGSLVALNCATLPEQLAESLLFGHERGAFTGAAAAHVGLLERAHGGTLLLDEIGDLPGALQAKLLRALETRRVSRLGEAREREVDLRVVAATNRDLLAEVRAGRFRQDLYYRIAGATVALPPLRDRRRELPLLARAFLRQARARQARAPLEISCGAMQRLLSHEWLGNLRELRNAMEFVATTASEGVAEAWHLPAGLGGGSGEGRSDEAEQERPAGFAPIADEVRELERRRMGEALLATGGNHRRAAALLSMPLRTFATKIKRYGLGG